MSDLVYIAHAVKGNLERNVEEIKNICRFIHTRDDEVNEDVVPFAPYLTTLEYLDDDVKEERELGKEKNKEFLRSGFFDELYVTGPTLLGSEGMKGEIRIAAETDLPFRVYNPRELKREGIVENYNEDLEDELEEYLDYADFEVPDYLKLEEIDSL